MNSADFKTLIFQMAGSDYHRIEVSTEVWDSYILPKIIRKFVEVHYDGSTKKIYPLTIDSDTTTYVLDSDIESITSVLSAGTVDSGISPVKLYKERLLRDGISNTNLSDYTLFQGFIAQSRITTENYYHWNFNRISKEFTLFNPAQAPASLFLEAYSDRSVDLIEDIREHDLFQEMALAQLYISWSRSLLKYDRALIGGSTLSREDIATTGQELWEVTIEKLKTEESEQPEIEFG